MSNGKDNVYALSLSDSPHDCGEFIGVVVESFTALINNWQSIKEKNCLFDVVGANWQTAFQGLSRQVIFRPGTIPKPKYLFCYPVEVIREKD